MALNFLDIPQGLATQLGLDLFSGQLLSGLILMAIVLLPTTILAKGRRGAIFELFMGFATLCFTIAIGWLPSYILIILSCIVALQYAGTFKKMITGE